LEIFVVKSDFELMSPEHDSKLTFRSIRTASNTGTDNASRSIQNSCVVNGVESFSLRLVNHHSFDSSPHSKALRVLPSTEAGRNYLKSRLRAERVLNSRCCALVRSWSRHFGVELSLVAVAGQTKAQAIDLARGAFSFAHQQQDTRVHGSLFPPQQHPQSSGRCSFDLIKGVA
jgi:hypothetical protein